MMNTKSIEQETFIIDWCTKNVCVSVTNQSFHDAFFEKFGGKRKEYLWGAMPVNKAMTKIRKMHKQGILERKKISLGGSWKPGFPKWQYVYSLNEFYRRYYERKSISNMSDV